MPHSIIHRATTPPSIKFFKEGNLRLIDFPQSLNCVLMRHSAGGIPRGLL